MSTAAEVAARALENLGIEPGQAAQVNQLNPMGFEVSLTLGQVRVRRIGDLRDSLIWDVVEGLSSTSNLKAKDVHVVDSSTAVSQVRAGFRNKAFRIRDWGIAEVERYCRQLNSVTLGVILQAGNFE